jgi:outer membrane protein
VGTVGVLLLLQSSAEAESLREALRRTYYGNPTIKAEKTRGRAVKEQVTQAKAGWKPRVNFTASQALDWRNTSVTPYSLQAPATVAIQLSKPIYDGGRNRQLVKQAQANVGAAKQQSLATQQTVLFQVVQAYANVVRDRKVLAQRDINVRVLRELARATSKRFEVGEVTRTDVAQSNARVSGARAATASAKAQLASSEADYEQLVGRKPDRHMDWPAPAQLPSSLAAALSAAQRINPQILAAAFVEDAARHNKRAIAASGGWQVNLNANANLQLVPQFQPDRNFVRQESAHVDVTASLPLYDGGQRASEVREAGYVASQRRIEKISAVRLVRENVNAAWSAYQSTLQSIESARSQVAATKLALDGVNTEYTVGSRSTVDVLNVQQELVNSEVSLIFALHSRIVNSYQLQAATGRLTGAALGF